MSDAAQNDTNIVNTAHAPSVYDVRVATTSTGMAWTTARGNRQRLNCVSAVQFLASLGIKDFPVYGLATSGQYGHVSSTWFSSADNVRHLFYARS